MRAQGEEGHPSDRLATDLPVLGAEPVTGVDPEWLSGIIGSIYDCVLEPLRWQDTIGEIAREFGFTSAALGVMQLQAGAHQLHVHYGFDAEWIATGDRYMEESVRLWGGYERVQAYPLEEPIVATQIRPAAEFELFPYYREILKPRGLVDAVLIGLAREQALIGYIGLNRHFGAGPITERELAGLRLIAPHMRRAVTISNLFDLQGSEATAFKSALEHMSSAVVMIDEEMGIVHANRAATAMLAGGDIAQSVQGRLKIMVAAAHAALERAVSLAAQDEVLLAQRGIAVPSIGEGSERAILHVLPLSRGALRRGLAKRAVAAVFIVTGSRAAEAPVDAIAMLYDFTPAESQLFGLIAAGTSLEDASDTLGVARSTTKTHLSRIFAKTGCNRQAELAALASRLSLRL